MQDVSQSTGPWAQSVDARHLVRSPEQVLLDLPLAGPANRILAYGVDYALIVFLQIVVFLALLLATPLLELARGWLERFAEQVAEQPDAMQASPSLLLILVVAIVIQLVIEWGYFIFWEFVTSGRSPGKMWMKLRVVRDGGIPMTAREILMRNLLRMVDMLPVNYLIGLVAMVANDESKRLGDLAAGTIVVRLDRPPAAAPLSLDGAGSSDFIFARGQIERIGSLEVTLIRQTLRRIEGGDPALTPAVLERIAGVIARKIEHPPVAPHEREAFLRSLLRAVESR